MFLDDHEGREVNDTHLSQKDLMKMNNRYFLVFSLVVAAVQQAQTSHFRGAIITWKPGQNPNEIVIEYRISWRMTYSSNFNCNSYTVENRIQIPGEGSITCFKNCYGSIGDLAYICTDYSLTEDWSSGRGFMTYTLYQNSYIEFGFSGGAWISNLNYGSGGSWMLRVTADLTPRSDTGRINSSPTAEISPIVRLAYGCNHTISIPVYDVDGDVVRCHWADSSKDQCAAICSGFPKSYMYFDTCVITYEAIYQTGWYAVAIQVEDYLTNTSTSPLSSIPVQFLVKVEPNPTKICTRQVEFIQPTLPENTCIGVPIGDTFESVIVARASSSNRSITDINTISPVGLTKTGFVKVSATDWRLNWTYAPRADETDKNHPFCFTAIDDAGFQSKKRCFTLLAGVSPPQFVKGTQLPLKKVHPFNKQWIITSSLEFKRTPRRSFIHLHNRTGGLLESLDASDSSVVTVNTMDRRLEFTTTTWLIEKEEYYFTFDFGVLKGVTDCGAESLAVDDPYFWRFRVRDITPPTIQFTNQSIRTNSRAEFAWTVNEPVTTTCSLTYLNAYMTVDVSNCNNSWTKSNLTEGQYELLIKATDIEGNSATRLHIFLVDTTPPSVRFLQTPANISGSDPVFFEWYCDYCSSTYCSIVNLGQSKSCPSNNFNWKVGNKTSNVTYNFRLQAVDDVGNIAVIEHKWTTDFKPPTIIPCDKGQSLKVNCSSGLQPELICNVTAQDNMDRSPFLNYTDKTAGKCNLNRTWTAMDVSGNIGKYVQNIQIVREGSIKVSQLRPVSVACGTLSNMTEALKSMFVINHPCNLDVQITYEDNATESCDAVIERKWTIADNCGKNVSASQIIKIRKTRLPLAPENGQTGTDLKLYLRWQTSTAIGNYSVYLWERDQQRPNNPSIVTYETLFYAKSLRPGTMYRWQVVYNYANGESYLSPIWVFKTRAFADLAVVQIIVPPTAYTGEDCEVKWTVVNQGNLATQQSYWTDAVYFAWDGTIQNAKLVLTVPRRDILNENDSYSSIATFKFGEMEFGRANIFVSTNYDRNIEEYNWVNNMKRNSSSIDVKLTAPPDLIVSSIHLPSGRVFSGSRVTISWTVVNYGAGPTKEGYWFDAVWWSSSHLLDTTAKQIATVQHFGNLLPNTNYTQTLSVQVPEFIYGKHYFTVNVDAFNKVFEYLSENNSLTSKAIEVVLTPPPDLVVNTIYTPTVWRTGEIVTVNWTVENKGNDSPRSQTYWEDAAVIVTNARTRFIGSNSHNGILLSREKYWSILRFYVSPDISTGDYDLTITTDYRDNLFEFDMENNNALTKTIKVAQQLPDLKVMKCSFVIAYVANSTQVVATWQVKNSGNGKTLTNEWVDTIAVKNPGDYFYSVLSRSHIATTSGLNPSESYNHSEKIDLPFGFYGHLVFKLTVDDLYHSTGDSNRNNNNFEDLSVNVELKAADLVLESVSLSEYIVGGKDISVSYVIKNQGNFDVNDAWRNRVFITRNANDDVAVFGIDQSYFVNSSLNRNSSQIFRAFLSLPDEMSGLFYLVVVADVYNTVFEGPNTVNNRVVKSIDVKTAPAADLNITSVKADVTDGFGINKVLNVEWRVKNIGNSMQRVITWQDSVFYKLAPNAEPSKTLNTYSVTNSLESQGSYIQKHKILLPSTFVGNIFICAETDTSGKIYEAGVTQNNILCQKMPISLNEPSAAKLSVTLKNLSAHMDSDWLSPGRKAVITYDVHNIGESPTFMSSWTDGIYILNTSEHKENSLAEFIGSGIRVREVIHIGRLEPNQSYSVTTTFLVPVLIKANPLVFVVANDIYEEDHSEIPGSSDHTDSEVIVKDKANVTDSNFQQIKVSFILPNLRISNSSVPKNAQGGQPVTLEYDILNTGNVSVEALWYDSALLSKDVIVDAFSTKLASVQRHLRLEPDENITVNMSFILPLDLVTQSYYLTIVTDSRDDVFEENESDNDFKIVFNMDGRQSADILVSNVLTPSTAMYGSDMKVSWQVANNGTKDVSGYKCDSVYLSTDNVWDINDAQVGKPECLDFTLKALTTNCQYSSLTTETPVVPAASYNTLVKSRSNILDMNLDNNVAVASNKTEVMYATNGVGSSTTTSLKPNGFVALRYINVSEGMTLLVNITSENKDVFNSIFIKGGNPATLYDFDKSSTNPNLPEQLISITDTRFSEYYVLVENSGSLTSNRIQNITITVKYAQFEIFDVFPKTLIPNAATTLHIFGTLFPYDMRIQLRNEANSIKAINTYIFSSTDAYATFFLSNTNVSETFNITLESELLNKTIHFKTMITLIDGTHGFLIYSTNSPSRLRIGETGIMSINLQNAGDSDILAPMIVVDASSEGSLRLIDEAETHSFEQRYVVFCSMENGPAGILPPKSKCQLKFETKQNETFRLGRATMTVNTRTIRPSKFIPNPYSEMKTYFKPTHYSTNDWEEVWKNFISATGNSSLSFNKKLSDVLNAMSLGGRYVKNVDDAIRFLLEYADAPYSERYLFTQSDFLLSSETEVGLEMNRFLSSRIGSRSQRGYMGKGWILPLWDTKVKGMTENDLILMIEKIDYHFVKHRNNTFFHEKLGTIEETNTDFIYTPNKQRRQFHYDRQTFALTEIDSVVDDSYLKLQYHDSRLTRIRHSSGAFVTVTYDRHDRIQTMKLDNATIASNNAKLLCLYDLNSGMLSVVRRNGKLTRYAYHSDNSLQYIINPDRSMILYEYSDIGYILAKKFIRNNKPILTREFSYSPDTTVTVKSKPGDGMSRLTFDENGEIIRVQRTGFLPDKTVKTNTLEIQYDGDMVVGKRMFSNDGDTLIIEDGNGDQLWTYFNDKNQLIKFKDGGGNEYKININKNGSFHSIIFPDGSNKTYRYVQNGHVVVTQNNGIKKYGYNDRQQLTMKDIGNNSIYTYDYDENGLLVNIRNKIGKVAISYQHDKTKDVTFDDVKINYDYDGEDRLSRLSTNNDYIVNYSYDDHGRLQSVTNKDNVIILRVRYNEAGKITEKYMGNNASSTYEYDSNTGLLRNLTNYFPNGSIASYFRYKYSVHQRRIVVDSHAGTWKYKYDRAGQIIAVTDPKGNVTKYVYDNRKNRIKVSINGIDQETKVNNMNQYMKYGKTYYSYDRNGNMNLRNGSTPEYFTFDEDNKFVGFKSDRHNCTFEYDALDNLYAKKCDGRVTRYVINPKGNYGSDIIEQIIEKNGKKTRVQFYHGGTQIGLIAAKYDDGSMLYFMYDPLGTVANVLNANGILINDYTYDPFGNSIASTETVKTPFGFLGQRGVVAFEEVPDIYVMRTRLYDAHTGRFLSIDAYGLKAHSKNLYAYCSNNPVHFIDPKGDFALTLFGLATGAVLGAAEYAITTPYKDWTPGGFTGAAVSAGIKGAAVTTGFLPGLVIGVSADVTGSIIQRKIDHQPNTFQNTRNDIVNSFKSQVMDKMVSTVLGNIIPKIYKTGLRTLQAKCQLLNFLNVTELKEVCDAVMKGLIPLTKTVISWVVSKDPNDILGPAGFGAARFLNKKSSLEYKIRFENDANATAPAQRVYIEHEYSKHLDPRSFTLDEFGFGSYTEKIGRKSIQKTIDLTNERGVVLRVFAGLDLIQKTVIWEFQSLDPNTGEAPIDPGVGFLPPNNGTSGQGYVSFTMQPKETADHLSTIHANASIYFDRNDPIDTPNIFNTIDDSAPTVNATVITETESQDSVTLSFSREDSGSGVKYVDLFKQQGNSFSMFRADITEDIYIMPLRPGDSYSIVAIATDYVGNRFHLFPNNMINVTSSKRIEDCQCSGNGNCSYGTDICICMHGFYGPYCNSTSPPPEPPVLEIQSQEGFVNESIEISISAKNLSGSQDELEIYVSGFQNDTRFSAGHVLEDGRLHLTHEEFGKLNMTAQNPGQIKLTIMVIQTSTKWNFTRSGQLSVTVYESIEMVNISLQGCVAENNGRTVVLINSSVVFVGESDSNHTSSIVPHSTVLKLPNWLHPADKQASRTGSYEISDTLLNSVLSVDNKIEPFVLSVTVDLDTSDLASSTFSKEIKITQFCGRECDFDKFGMNCDQMCSCNFQNTENCDQFTGICICKPEWKGPVCNEFACPCVVNNTAICDPLTNTCECKKGWNSSETFMCDTDIDECHNTSICDDHANTTCQNSIPDFECLCRRGFEAEGSICVELKEPKENRTVIIPSDEKITPVIIHIDIVVPPTDNLEVEVTYKKYEKEAVQMLSDYYRKKLGDSFIKVIVQKLSLGSLIIDHDVITKDIEKASEDLAVAVVEMAQDGQNTSLLVFYGQNVKVEGVSLNNTEVKDACEVFSAISPCDLNDCKEDKDGKPTCRKVAEPSVDNKGKTILIVSLSVGIPVVVIAIVIVTCYCVRKNKKEDTKNAIHENVEFLKKSKGYEHRNPAFSDSEADEKPTWQRNPFFEANSSHRGKYVAKHNAYVYTGRLE